MVINGRLFQYLGRFRVSQSYTDRDGNIIAANSWAEPNFLDDYFDEDTRLTYKWDGTKYINKQFFTSNKYYKNNNDSGVIETTQIYLAKPGQRLIGALNGIQEDSASLTINLNNTDTLDFTVDRIVDGDVSNFYDLIGQHYELYLPNRGWFKINEEPVISGDGNTETKSVHAESLEIELQQYDLVDFHINTGSVYSKEYLAVDNIYDFEEYQLFHNQVLFYRDTTDLEALTAEFKTLSAANQTVANLENLWSTKYPNAFYWEPHTGNINIFSAWRITFDANNHIVLDLDKYDEDNPGDYTIAEFLDMEIERMHSLSLLWLILNEHDWKIGFVDPYFDSESEFDDDKIPLAYKVGYFEIDSQDSYSFLTQDAAAYYRCIFLFDTDNRIVNVYNVNNIGYDTNIFLSFNNIQNSVERNSDRQLTTVFHVSGGEELDFTEVNFGEDWIEDLSYFMTTEHFPQSLIDKYNIWKEYRDSRLDDYVQTSLDGRIKRDEIYDLTYKVPLDGTDEKQWDTLTLEELEADKADYIATLTGLQAQIDAMTEEQFEAFKLKKEYADYISIKDVILSDPLDALDHVVFSYNNTSNIGGFHFFDDVNDKVIPYVEEVEDPETGDTVTNIVTYRLGNIDKAMFKKMQLDGDYIPETETEVVIDEETGEPVIDQETGEPETVITYQPSYNERAAALSYASQKEFLENYQYDFKKYGDSYGTEELKTQLDDLKARYELLEQAGYGIEPENGATHPHELAMYNLYLKYKQAADECQEELDERTEQLDDANEELDEIIAAGLAIKADVAITNPQFNFTEDELRLLDRYYIHNDYTNENIEYLEHDTPEQIIQKEKALLDDALEQLYVESHPQWNWSTSQDNLYLMPEFKDWHDKLHVGNFIRVSMRDDYQVKLRVATIQLNPFLIDPTVEIQFSSMLQYRAKRNDYWNLLNETNSSQKNQISRISKSTGGSDSQISVDSALILKLLNNSQFMTGVSNGVAGIAGTIIGNAISLKEINVGKITGTEAEFRDLYADTITSNLIATKLLYADNADINNLQSKLITADKIIAGLVNAPQDTDYSLLADSAFIEYLNSDVIHAGTVDADYIYGLFARIDVAQFNHISADSAFVTSLQARTTTALEDYVTSARIIDLIAGNITASQIGAGTLSLANGMQIASNNPNGGNVLFNGSALQFFAPGDVPGAQGVQPGIQIGYNVEDSNGNVYPHIFIRDQNGASLWTSTGITQNAIVDDLIVNRMISDGTIQKSKLGFPIVDTDSNGNISITSIKDGSGGSFGVSYTQFQKSVDNLRREVLGGGITLRIYPKVGNGVITNDSSTTLSIEIVSNGETVSTSGLTTNDIQWYKYSSGNYTAISGANAVDLVVTASMVDDLAMFKVIVSYGGNNYTAYYTVDDLTDPYSAETFSTIDTFTSYDGCGAIYTKVYQNGAEIDPLLSTTFSDTEPDNPSNGDYFYYLDKTNKQCVLKRYNGTAWVNGTENYQRTYAYYRLNVNGTPIDTSNAYKTQRCIYIDPTIVNATVQFICEVS